MLSRLFRKEKPRIFLGILAVAPRSDFKQLIEDWDTLGQVDFDDQLRRELREIFTFRSLDDREEARKTDLALDIIVSDYRRGGAIVLERPFEFFWLWRPAITMSARLYDPCTGKSRRTFVVKERMPLGRWFRHRFGGIFDLGPTYDAEDLKDLLHQTSVKLLTQLKKAV